MPRATHNMQATERFELKSLPEGYVVLRRLNYSQYLERQGMAMEMKMSASGGRGDRQVEADIKMAQQRVAEFEFAHCVVEHNLTDDNDKPLDFQQKWTVGALDVRVGQEIGEYINSMNDFEGDLGNSATTSDPSSSLVDAQG